ncbi:MAG: xanthine dehydrogenase [Candidatus Cloacimonas sp. 4484_140]|nr:MAG: xanthine dehydrogenase [Candidatus Cloacimonas sp. 4484_140]
MKNDKFNVIGRKLPRTDAYEKVTGKAQYAADIIFPNMCFTAQKRVPIPHGIIKKIDISEAEKVSGIDEIITSKDIPGTNMTGVVNNDQPVFAYDKIYCPADVVALVVGEDREAIRKALTLIKIEVDELPVLSDYTHALDNDTLLIHPENKSNLINYYPLRKGNIDKGFQESDIIIERTYTTPAIEHAYIEPECITAVPDFRKDVYKIYGSVQNPFTCRRIVAQVMKVPLANIYIIQNELGGSFGGKDDTMDILAARACVACKKVGKPVRIHLSREESIVESYKRHPYTMNYKVGVSSKGILKAMKIDILADGGAYASMSPFVTWRSVVQATGPYEVKNVHTDIRAVYTNNPYTGAMRGFGSPQIIFAQESLMDELAEKLHMSPIEIRRINGYKQNSETASGQILSNHIVSLNQVIDKATKESDFEKKYETYKARYPVEESSHSVNLILNDNQFSTGLNIKEGIGLACSFRGCSLGAEGVDATGALISIQKDGSVYLISGLAENGQGLRMTFSMIAAEILGISPDDIYYLEQDTSRVADGGPTVASRSTLVGGEAVKNAAKIVKRRIEKMLIDEWDLSERATLKFADHYIVHEGSGKKIAVSEACNKAYLNGVNLSAYGWFKAPEVDWDEEIGQGPAYFTYVYGCQIAEVEVNAASGKIFVKRVTAVHDAGQIINRMGALGQIYGGVYQGAGYGIMEEVIVKNTEIQNVNFDEYLIPTSVDVGEIKAFFIENPDTFGPFGAKSLGEPTLEITAAAINNAVSNALGKRFYHLPLDLEQIKTGKSLHHIKK